MSEHAALRLSEASCQHAEVRACGRIMIGSGTDTYDPICDLPDGHDGCCKSSAAIDQHRFTWRCDQCGRVGSRGFEWVGDPKGERGITLLLVCKNVNACRKRWPTPTDTRMSTDGCL